MRTEFIYSQKNFEPPALTTESSSKKRISDTPPIPLSKRLKIRNATINLPKTLAIKIDYITGIDTLSEKTKVTQPSIKHCELDIYNLDYKDTSTYFKKLIPLLPKHITHLEIICKTELKLSYEMLVRLLTELPNLEQLSSYFSFQTKSLISLEGLSHAERLDLYKKSLANSRDFQKMIAKAFPERKIKIIDLNIV